MKTSALLIFVRFNGNELLQHDLSNIDGVALRIDDVYEIQSIAAPGIQT